MMVKAGDKVTRIIGGYHMELRVTKVTDDLIVCGPWEFDRETGMEIDETMEWGPKWGATGSRLLAEGE